MPRPLTLSGALVGTELRTTKMTTSSKAVDEALRAIRAGGFVVVADDEDREDEGDLICAAESVDADRVAFLLRYTSGLICTAITAGAARRLDLPLMVDRNTESMRTAFTVTVDAREGTTTGISAEDRARTIRLLADPRAAREDLLRPGHVLPLVARSGGVLKRAGHTEAAVDLCEMAGLEAAGVLCEIVSEDRRTMLRGEALRAFAKTHDLPFLTIADLIRHRRRTERIVEPVSESDLPLTTGVFRCRVYRSLLDGIEHLALFPRVMAEDGFTGAPLVRVHSECLTGDVFGSRRCDCGEQLEIALARVATEGGFVVYLRGQEGRGIGLGHKIRAYALQDAGRDTVEANEDLGLPIDSREYGVGAQILADLGVTSLRLLTNNPRKFGGLEGYGLSIVEQVPLTTVPKPENVRYLETKRTKLGHTSLQSSDNIRPRQDLDERAVESEPSSSDERRVAGERSRHETARKRGVPE